MTKKIRGRMKLFPLALVFILLPAAPLFADVMPFEEEYSAAPQQEAPFSTRQEMVTKEERAESQEMLAEENRTDRYLSYREITFQNCGQIFLNLFHGLGVLYHDLFTRAFPEYGADLVSIPGGTVEVTGKFVEIERKEFFERDAKKKDIEAYVASQEAPLTAEEKKLLDDLRGKPISSSPTGK